MDDAMKKRVIGVAALASLAVIFMPMLVEQSPDYTPPIPGMVVPRPDFDAKHQERLQPLADDLTRMEKADNPVLRQLDTPPAAPVAVPASLEKPNAPGPAKPATGAPALKAHPAPAKLALEPPAPKVHATHAKLTVEPPPPASKSHTTAASPPTQSHVLPKTARTVVAETHVALPSPPPAPPVAVKKAADKPMDKPMDKIVEKPKEKIFEKPKEKPKEKPVPKESVHNQGGGTTWAVQVGSFSTQEKAQGVVDQLRGRGFAAFQESVVISQRTLYRVRVGPDNDRTHTEKVAGQIQQQFALPGRVIPYR